MTTSDSFEKRMDRLQVGFSNELNRAFGSMGGGFKRGQLTTFAALPAPRTLSQESLDFCTEMLAKRREAKAQILDQASKDQ